MARVLIVDQFGEVAANEKKALLQDGHTVDITTDISPENVITQIRQGGYHIVSVAGGDTRAIIGSALIRTIKQAVPDVKVVGVSSLDINLRKLAEAGADRTAEKTTKWEQLRQATNELAGELGV